MPATSIGPRCSAATTGGAYSRANCATVAPPPLLLLLPPPPPPPPPPPLRLLLLLLQLLFLLLTAAAAAAAAPAAAALFGTLGSSVCRWCLVVWLHREDTTVVMSYELHGYQRDFLATLGTAHGSSQAAALESIVGQAISSPATKSAIFDEFHCIHCGSVDPAEWIATRKGDKKPMTLPLSTAAASFLEQPMLVKVERLGEPPKKQVVPGAPKHADSSKAVRCCVDWCDTCDQHNQDFYSFSPFLPLCRSSFSFASFCQLESPLIPVWMFCCG
eukprot:COSAG02_NODE_11414_length_1728_cov_215.445058_2_plen_273_part_00